MSDVGLVVRGAPFVGEDGKAMRRDVQLGGTAEGLRVVTSGLKAGDRVVVNGVRKIFFPGMPVKPVVVPMDQPDFAPAQAGGGAPAGAPPAPVGRPPHAPGSPSAMSSAWSGPPPSPRIPGPG